jgi:hypothetical protein
MIHPEELENKQNPTDDEALDNAFHDASLESLDEVMLEEESKYVHERQWCGYVTAVIILLALITGASRSISFFFAVPVKYPLSPSETTFTVCLIISLFLSAGFFLLILCKRDYLKGEPGMKKMWPVALGSLVRYVGNVVNMIATRHFFGIVGALIVELIICGSVYTVYFAEDDSKSCCLCFKPWKTIEVRIDEDKEIEIVIE